MHIESVTIKNFRCFGPDAQTVTLTPSLTALIGGNGAGKSAFLEALRRVFGASLKERTLTLSDFYFAPDERPEDVQERELTIDIVLAFPELRAEDPDALQTVPTAFSQLTAKGPGDELKARILLEAKLTRSETASEEVDSNLYWVTTLDDVGFGEDGPQVLDKRRMTGADRRLINFVYMPASRDGAAVAREAMARLLQRLERSGAFSAADRQAIEGFGDQMQEAFDTLPAVKSATEALTTLWGALHGGAHLRKPRLAVATQEFMEILRRLTADLSPAPDGRVRKLGELSEGQTSLFFLALAATVAELEAKIASGSPPEGFEDLDYDPPALTIYALEEPENHLSPFYLSRTVRLLEKMCSGAKAVALLTTHSPGALYRLEPYQIRHFRLDVQSLSTRANEITLPERTDEAAKYLGEAVRAQPELYFANLVILGEGDSEALIIPRLAQALGADLDPSFIAFAPLGGRHVNHFWKLLDQLAIPHLTLLDLDLGRHGGGTGRVKYAYNQLKALNGAVDPPRGVSGDPDTDDYWESISIRELRYWMSRLRRHGVYFSWPLDIDMSMLRKFPEAYEVDAAASAPSEDLLKSVFGKRGSQLAAYARLHPSRLPSNGELEAYHRLFKTRGKPGSHLTALADIDDEVLAVSAPPELKALVAKAQEMLSMGLGREI